MMMSYFNRFGPSGLLHETPWKVGIISFGSTRLPEGFKPIWHFAADVAWEWSKIKRCLLGSSWFRVDLCDGKSVVELLDCGAFLFTLYQTNIAMERNIPILNGKYIFIFKCQTVGFPLSCQFFGVNSISKLPGTPAIETANTSWYQMVWRSNDSVWRVIWWNILQFSVSCPDINTVKWNMPWVRVIRRSKPSALLASNILYSICNRYGISPKYIPQGYLKS